MDHYALYHYVILKWGYIGPMPDPVTLGNIPSHDGTCLIKLGLIYLGCFKWRLLWRAVRTCSVGSGGGLRTFKAISCVSRCLLR